MPSFNQVTLMGHLTRDAEMRSTQTGKSVTHFGLGVNSFSGGDKEDVVFLNCTAWDKQAEALQNLKKGEPLFVQGRLKMNKWTDKEGKEVSKIEVVVSNFQFLGMKGGGGKKPKAPDTSPTTSTETDYGAIPF